MSEFASQSVNELVFQSVCELVSQSVSAIISFFVYDFLTQPFGKEHP